MSDIDVTSGKDGHSTILAIAALVAAWSVMYFPLYLQFMSDAWLRDENAHIPFIVAIIVSVLGFKLSRAHNFSAGSSQSFAAGVGLFAIGSALYVTGQNFSIDTFSSGSQVFILVGLVTATIGFSGARLFAFPLLMTVFLVVWPGWAIDAFTAPMKLFVSQIVSEGLFLFGAPVAHSGAVISIGSYELLVADACSGLNSLIALGAVGAVYLYAAGRRAPATIGAVMVMIVPIAIVANIVRVAVLVLLTYHGGYDVGQSYLHETAGLVLFATALLCVFAVDAIIARRCEQPQ